MRVVVFVVTLLVTSVCYANSVAIVVRTGGDVVKTSTSNDTLPVKRRDTLSEGDQISTGDGAYATLKFADQSVVDLSENTTLRITRFRPDSDQGKANVFLELLTGKLRTITGNLAKEPNAFDLRTAHASIGVRGTEFEVQLVSESETQVLRHAGSVIVRSLEFQGQVVELTESHPRASVTLGSPAKLMDAPGAPSLGPIPASILELANGLSAPPLLPVAVVAVPAVVPLSANGNTPVDTGSRSESLEPIEAFVAMVNNNQWAEARLLANELIERFEGLPRFDLYHGLLLMAENNPNEAIFSFERVLVFNPEQHRARLELGRAYLMTGNFNRARDALNQVLLANPPTNVRRNVETLLKQVDEAELRAMSKTEFGGTVLAGWDSNGNAGSNLDGPLDPNLLGLTELSGVSAPVESGFVQWSVTTGMSTPTSQTARNQFSVDFTNKNYLDAALNDTSALTLGTVINRQQDRWRSQIPFTGQWSWLDGQSWQGSVSVGFSQHYRIWGPLWAGVKIGTQMNIALDDANVSNAKDLAGIVFDAQERGRVHTFSSLYLQTMQAGLDDGHSEWRGIANRYQLVWTLPWNIRANFAAEHQWRRYKADDLFFTENDVSTDLKLRQDQVITMELQGAWAPTNWLQTQTQLSWEWVDSNINVYGRDRITASQAISVRF